MMRSLFTMCMAVRKITVRMVGLLELLVLMVLQVQIGGKHLEQMVRKLLQNLVIQTLPMASFNKVHYGE